MIFAIKIIYTNDETYELLLNIHWRQTGRKSGGAEWEFETYSVLQDQKTMSAPAAPASLAPM